MYKTKYKAAMAATKTAYEQLVPKTRATFDEVVSLETNLQQLHDSLKDADKDDKPGINDSIAGATAVLKELDEGLVLKIQRNAETVANVERMQKGRTEKRALKATPPPAQQQATPPPAQQQAAATPPPAQQQATPPPAQQQATPPPAQQQAAATPPPAQQQAAATPPPAQQQAAAKPNDAPVAESKKKGRITIWQIIGGLVTVGLAGYGIHASLNHKFPFNKK